MSASRLYSTELVWCLVGGSDETGKPRQVRIASTPFQIGRRPDLSLSLDCRSVSALHAELVSDGEFLWARDLQSTNGTYVNGQRISQAVRLQEGDFVQFAKIVFRLGREAAGNANFTVHEEGACDQALALIQFDKLMNERSVIPYFQPIVRLVDQATVGHEVLIRSPLFGLQNPSNMFLAASVLDLEAELSRLCRWEGVQAGAAMPSLPNLYLNTHPRELADVAKLCCSLRELREQRPGGDITLEIHEAAITDLTAMRELMSQLCELNIGLAYDDFGAGQARLVELTEVPPDVLKFDMKLVQGIHVASPARQQMLATLVRMVAELGIVALAEGVESDSDSQTCAQLGFQLGQGFLYGRPAPAHSYVEDTGSSR